MTMFVVQTLLLVIIAFVLGCFIGGLLRQLFGAAPAAPAEEPVAQKQSSKAAISPSADLKNTKKPANPVSVVDTRTTEPIEPEAVKESEVPAAKNADTTSSTTVTSAGLETPDGEQISVKQPMSAAGTGKPDDLTKIKGVGKHIAGKLHAEGVTRFTQIAAWTTKEAEEIGDRLAFKGRIEREDWIAQAKALSQNSVDNPNDTDTDSTLKESTKPASTQEPNPIAGSKPELLSEPRNGKADNLAQIEGIGVALEQKLFALGVFHYSQISGWNKDQREWVGNALGFPGRPERENWSTAAGDLANSESPEGSGEVSPKTSGSSRKAKIT